MPFLVRPPADPPPHPENSDRTPLTEIRRVVYGQGRRLGARFRAPLPFPIERSADKAEPLGLAVYHDGQRLPWKFSQRGDGKGYRMLDGEVLLFWPEGEPRPEALELHHPARTQHLQRLHPEASALDPAAFVSYTHTIDHESRRGWLLPTDTEITLELDLLRRSRIDAQVALLPESKGPVTISIVSERNGKERLIGQRRITQTDHFTPWSMTLDAYETDSHRLKIRAEGPDPAGLAFLAHPTLHPPARTEAPKRVVWVGLDTTRRDHLGLYGYKRRTTPNLDRWSERATVFTNTIAPAPRTRPSFRSALTGRRPLDAVGAPSILALLDAHDYATAGLVANPHLVPRFGFAEGTDYWLFDHDAPAAVQVDRAVLWLKEHAAHNAALFLHLMDPHLGYTAPEPYFEQFAVEPDPQLPARLPRREILQRMRDGELTRAHQAQLIARYDGEIAYLDQQLARLFYAIDQLPGPTLVIIHSDHGEELWDRGGFEHNHSLHREVIDVPLLIRAPGKGEGLRVDHPVELADLAPTTLDLLQLDVDVPFDGQSLRPLFRQAPLPERPRGMAHLMYDTDRWGVRAEDHTYILHTASGQEELYNLLEDPFEAHDLVEAGADPARFRPLLAEAHGIEVGPGWRVRIELDQDPVHLELPAKALSAGVLDPEASERRRANQVWGERPKLAPDDIADVELLNDGMELAITPGPSGRGIVYVRFKEPTPATGGLRLGARVAALHDRGPIVPRNGVSVHIQPGTIVVPPLGEAARIAALAPWTHLIPEDQREALRALGYLGE